MRAGVEGAFGVALRCWKTGDAPAVLTAFADPRMRGQADEPIGGLEDAERWVTHRMAQWADGSAHAFAVVGPDGAVLGGARVGRIDHRHSTAWVSYWTTAEARGRGVASAACRRLSRWSFDELGLFRLELGHRVNNPASCAVARAAAFAVEGLERQRLEYDGVRYDVERHARLATDEAVP